MTLGIDVSRLYSEMVLVRAGRGGGGCLRSGHVHVTRGLVLCSGSCVLLQASNTKDLVVKKMVYLYLTNYAQSHPDLTLLAINTLQKDRCAGRHARTRDASRD